MNIEDINEFIRQRQKINQNSPRYNEYGHISDDSIRIVRENNGPSSGQKSYLPGTPKYLILLGELTDSPLSRVFLSGLLGFGVGSFAYGTTDNEMLSALSSVAITIGAYEFFHCAMVNKGRTCKNL